MLLIQRFWNKDRRRQNEDDFSTLVALNWPFLKGTTIPVLDVGACARRGTPEQRRTGKQVRAAIERLWELDEGHPARLELERVYRPCTCAHYEQHVVVEQSPEAAKSPPLPTELMIKILKLAITEEKQDNAELLLFGRLRLVATPVKQLVEQSFPRTLSRYAARVVRDFLHVSRERSSVMVTQLALASAPLFEQVRTLAVWYTPDAEDEFNTILPHLINLEELDFLVTSSDIDICDVRLTACPRLERLHVGLVPPGPGVAEDVHLNKPSTGARRNKPPGTYAHFHLKQFRIGPLTSAHRKLLDALGLMTTDSLDVFDMSNSFLDPAAVRALLLFCKSGPASMNFSRCHANDDAITGLKLGTKETTRALILRDNLIRNPSVLSLSKNVSLHSVDLAFNALDSAAFALDANSHLRHLDLTACFRHCSTQSEQAGLLGELARQLGANETLECLLLADNGITDSTAPHFSLSGNRGLKKLSLADNFLSAASVGAVLAGNTALEEVDLRGNEGIKEQDARELSKDGARRIVL